MEVKEPDTTEQVRLGRRIRSHRLRAKLTQRKLAEALGVSYQMVQKLENGTARITVQRLNDLARIFKISAAELMGDFANLLAGELAGPPPTGYDLTTEERRLIAAYNRIQDKSLRRNLLELAERMTM
ncbi:MAG: hypothetical protein RL318_1992 [Fibrobacterota bacterium]